MNIILIGAPGAGKGTVGKLIFEHYSIPIISTGDLLRKEVALGTKIGVKAKEYMDRGDFVPDDIVTEMVKHKLKECVGGFILDGYPRTMEQAKALEAVHLDAVLNFEASKEIIIDRLLTRLTCKKCGAICNIKNIPPKKPGICDICGGPLYQREDQKPEAIRERLKGYEKETAPLLEYYKSKKLLRTIDANPKDPKLIFEAAIKALSAKDL